jgi:hypothetical protein
MTAKPLGPQNNPGQARWCEEHATLECTKNRTKGRGPCHKRAIRGTDACDMHGGYKRSVLKAQGEARITAFNPMAEPTKLDAGMTVLAMLQMTYLRVGMYAELLRQQVATDGDPGDGVIGGTDGLIGHRYGMGGKEGILYKQSEEVRALVRLEAEERDRVVKYAKVAHDMGISERITALAERWGDVVAGRVVNLLDALELTPAQLALVPDLLALHLGSIDLDQIEAPALAAP